MTASLRRVWGDRQPRLRQREARYAAPPVVLAWSEPSEAPTGPAADV